MLPGETFDSIYSLAPPDCSLKYFRQTYSVHCIRIYMYATNINEEILFVNHKNPLCEQNKSAPEYRFIITSGHFRLLHKIRALSRYLLVFNFRFSFFRYKSSAAVLLRQLHQLRIHPCSHFYIISIVWIRFSVLASIHLICRQSILRPPIPKNAIHHCIFSKKAGFSAISNGFVTKNHRSSKSFW